MTKKDAAPATAPLLSLRMKAAPSSSTGASQASGEQLMDHSVMFDIMAAMSEREDLYKCSDYLGREKKQQQQQRKNQPRKRSCSASSLGECSASTSTTVPEHEEEEEQQHEDLLSCGEEPASVRSPSPTSSSDSSSSSSNSTVDATCREKMCEWSYRVCDHFHTPREIVSFSISFLDRFVDRCACDRTAFKLASMTTLYMATKVFNGKQISIGTLAELSRGEFEICHIAEMERIILETLDWRLSPPTIQAFIGLLIQLILPSGGDNAYTREIRQRAVFFAELCAYDYSLVLHDKSLIAVAAILNAVEGMEDPCMAEDICLNFMESVRLDAPIPPIDIEQLESTQARLWYLFSCSAQAHEGGVLCLSSSMKRMAAHQNDSMKHHYHNNQERDDEHDAQHHHSQHSPVSVLAKRERTAATATKTQARRQ